MRALGLVILGGLLLSLACGGDPADPATPPRSVEASLALDANGISTEFIFEIPEATRSLAIVIEGDDDELLALASLRINSQELVGIALDVAPAAGMRAQYEDEQIGHMAGNLYQSIRLGTYAHLYPYAPGQAAESGPASLRVASTQTTGEVRVRILMAEEVGASTLHLNLISVSETVSLTTEPGFFARVAEILGAGGITVVVDSVVNQPGSGFASITDFSEPQETPGSMSAALAALGATWVSNDSLNVYFVDSLPAGVGGLSLGTPGPPVSDSYYFGVLIRLGADDENLARIVAHEVAHFLALQHVENRGISGERYPDPLEDTDTSTPNLMTSGTTITAGQSFALLRNPLLRLE